MIRNENIGSYGGINFSKKKQSKEQRAKNKEQRTENQVFCLLSLSAAVFRPKILKSKNL